MISRWKLGTFYEVLEDWKWILSYTRKHKKAIFCYTLFGIISASMGIVSSVAGKYSIDIIAGYDTEQLGLVIAIMLGSAVGSILFKNILNRISTRLSIDMNNDIKAEVFDHVMDADWLALNQYSNGDILNRFNGDINTVSSNAVSWLPSMIIACYNFIVTFFVILYYDVTMAMIAVLGAPLLFLSSRAIISKQREYGKNVREVSSDVMAFEVETISNYDTIKSLGVTKRYSNSMRNWQERLKDINLKYNLFLIKTNIWMSFLGIVVQYIAFGYCLYLLWSKSITFGTMTLFLQQRTQLSNAFNNVVNVVPSFLKGSISAHRIRELSELPKEVHIEGNSHIEEYASQGFKVQMTNVHFSYDKGMKVISDSKFMACPGEIVALVGPSGEGKTTMIRLFLGLIRPEEGEVVMVASNGQEVDVNAQTRHLFEYVPQGNTIFSGTIADNLRIVKDDATEEEMIEVLKIACAWDFVKKLPGGLYGKVGERGRGLSEGQAQRIAIARAILRNAPILLFDEATSALDIETERTVLANIVCQRPNKTCIITTHRPSVLGMCQRIYRVKETRLTELNEEETSQLVIDF